MTDETDTSEYKNSEDDIQYDSSVQLPSVILKFMTTLGTLVLAALAGYCIGWAGELLLQRLGG